MSKTCTPLWREAHVQVKMCKTHQSRSRSTFGSWDVGKVYTFVARSTSPSQNVQNTPGSEHVWKFRCRKSARRCGAKHLGSHTNHWKNTVFRDFMRLCYLSAHLHLLSSDSFFSSLLWLFPPLLFHLSILSEVWLLKFLWVQIHMRLYIHTPRAMHPKGHRHPLLPKVKAIGAQGLSNKRPQLLPLTGWTRTREFKGPDAKIWPEKREKNRRKRGRTPATKGPETLENGSMHRNAGIPARHSFLAMKPC